MFIHERGTDNTVISVNVDEVKIYLVFYVTDTYGNSGPIADLGSTADTSKLEYDLFIQLECVRLRREGELGSHRISGAARVK